MTTLTTFFTLASIIQHTRHHTSHLLITPPSWFTHPASAIGAPCGGKFKPRVVELVLHVGGSSRHCEEETVAAVAAAA